MADFPVTTFVEVIPTLSVSLVDTVTLSVTAKNLAGLTRVVLNGVDATEFMVVSPTRAIVTIPPSIRKSPLESIRLVGESDQAAIIEFRANTIQRMTDSVYVLQKYFRLLFMTPGSNVFNLDEGVNILSLVGTSVLGDIESDLYRKLKDAERQLKESQRPESEDSKLLSVVNINNISYSVNTLTAFISLTLETLDGSTVTADFNTVG